MVAFAIILGIILILLAVSLSIIFYITFSPMRIYSKQYRHAPSSIKDKGVGKRITELIDEVESEPFEELRITSLDGLGLFGRYYKGRDENVIIICFHGYRGHAFRDFCGGSKIARDNEISHILVDVRCHGSSEGKAITFGINETRDLQKWVEFALERFGENVKIVLSGVSMGAATVLMASDKSLPNVCGIIADCPYTSPKEIIKKVAADKKLSPTLFYPFIKLTARIFAFVNIDSDSPIKAVKNSKLPILIIHGDDDRFVPYEMGKRLFEECAFDDKEFVTVNGAGHAMSYLVNEKQYTKAVENFVSRVTL